LCSTSASSWIILSISFLFSGVISTPASSKTSYMGLKSQDISFPLSSSLSVRIVIFG
jgi:hypothetical protein